jgi:acyl carrier protein
MVLCDVNELREFMATNFLFSDDFSLGDADSFLDAGILDSTGVLQIILFLEERYQIALDDDEIVPENLDSIQRVKRFVDRKLTAAQATELTCDNSADVSARGRASCSSSRF